MLEIHGLLTVTKLAAGVRDPNRVNVFINDKFAFSLDVAQVVEYGVKAKRVITPERLEELKAASEFGKLYQRTLEWVLTRPHSMRETKDYLRRKQMKRAADNRQRARNAEATKSEPAKLRKVERGNKWQKLPTKQLPEIQEETMELVVTRLIERGYLDDRKFAQYYVENRFVSKGISPKRLKMELQRKGIAGEIISEVMTKIPRDEKKEMEKIIVKKRARYDDQKLVAYLVRQGFPYADAKEAVEKFGALDNFMA